MTNRFKIVLAAAVIVAAAAGVWRFGFFKGSEDARAVRTEVRPRIGSIARTISATAVIQPQNRLEMKPPVAGRIAMGIRPARYPARPRPSCR